MSREPEPSVPRGPLWPYALALVGLVGVGIAFGEVAALARQEVPGSLDRRVVDWVLAHRGDWPALTLLFRVATWLGNPWASNVAILLVAAWLAGLHRWKQGGVRSGEALFWLGVTWGGQLLNLALKAIFQRPRPPEPHRLVLESSYSFPSAHSVYGAVFFGMLAVLVVRASQVLPLRSRVVGMSLCLLLALLVAASRVWLGVHYPTDVVGGLLLGFAWVTAAWLIRYGWARWSHLRRAGATPA